jgi:uncharacterized membrane protein
MRRITQTFLSGLLAALPLIITIAVTLWLGSFIAEYIGPSSRVGRMLISLGLGVSTSNVVAYLAGLAIMVVAIYVLGLLIETRLSGWLSPVFYGFIQRIPIISNVYDLIQRFTSMVDRKGGDNLAGMSAVWCFFGGEPGAAVLALLASPEPVRIGEHEYLGVLVPSAPVPVGGALIYVPAAWIRPASGGVERLMNVYVSMGVTRPANTA